MITSSQTLGSAIAIVCYVIAANLRIELQEGDVTLAAAFAPVLVIAAQRSTMRAGETIVIAAVLAAFTTLIRRRSTAVVVRDLLALGAATAAVWFADVRLATLGAHLSLPGREIVGGGLAVLAFALVSDRGRHVRNIGPKEDTRVWLVLLGVLASAYGLMTLAYRQVGWPALIAILVVLALTKGEFDRYAMARRTLGQTVSALSALSRASLS